MFFKPTNSSSAPDEQDIISAVTNPITTLIISMIGTCFVATSILGNGLVILLLLRTRRLRTPTNYFILGMAVADFTCAVVLIPSIAIRLSPDVNMTPFECLLFWSSGIFTGCTSVLTLFLVSCDRYLKVVLPLRYLSILTNKVAIYCVIIVYLYSFVTTFGLPLFVLNQLHKEFYEPCFFQLSHIYHPVYAQFIIYVNFIVPLTLICAMYIHIFHVVVQKFKQEKLTANSSMVLGMKHSRFSWFKRELKTIKTMAILLGLCICGWVPTSVIMLAEIYDPAYQASLEVRTVRRGGYLAFCNRCNESDLV